MIGDPIQVFNRAPYALSFIKDGRERTLPPGLSYITADCFNYARTQNPIPGTEDPQNGKFTSLVSYVDPDPAKQKDALDTIPLEVLQSMPKERIDRNELAGDRRNAQTLSTPFPKGRVGMEDVPQGLMDPGAHTFAR